MRHVTLGLALASSKIGIVFLKSAILTQQVSNYWLSEKQPVSKG